jgi:ubiquinone biosynthesis monooxygenase Coq7
MLDTALGARILKVNHAGENGAVHIYAGQIFVARLTAPKLVAELREFKVHEERHRAIFSAGLQRRGQPRCRSHLVCGLGGLVLGLVTALSGRAAIAATTVAVEHRPNRSSGWACGCELLGRSQREHPEAATPKPAL